MCVVSNVGDHFGRRWPEKYPWSARPIDGTDSVTFEMVPQVSRSEFDELKREVEECKRLLVAAKEIDEITGQPDCELEEKIALIRRVAELVGVDIDDVLG
jgi:hypothetical protein